MKRVLALGLICFFILVNSSQAADWKVKVVSSEDVYEIGQKAVFKVKVKKDRKWVKDSKIILKAVFPDNDTPVVLKNVNIGRYRFKTILEDPRQEQTFAVTVYKARKPEKIVGQASKTITVISSEYDNSFAIKQGDYTNKNEITLLIDSNSNYDLFVSEDPLFAGASLIAYAPEMNYVLSGNDGQKAVYVKFINKFSQEEQIESKQIILDTIPPQMTILSPLDGMVVTGRTN